jgi:cold shock CspA family protein
MTGFVKKLVAIKNFGFIASSEDRKEYFFHREDFIGHWDDLVNDIENELRIEVRFEAVDSPKGLRAANVTRLDFPNQAVHETNE